MRLEIMMPPSINELWRKSNFKAVVKTPRYRAWRKAAVPLIKQQTGGRGYLGKVAVCAVYLFHGIQADVDNPDKALLDILAAAGVIKNDNMVWLFARAKAVDSRWMHNGCKAIDKQAFVFVRAIDKDDMIEQFIRLYGWKARCA